MEEKLTQEIFQKARELGVDLISSCSREAFKDNPKAQEEIEKINPQTRSILVYAVRMVSSSLSSSEENIRIAQFSTKLLYGELERITFALMKELDDRGYSSAPMPTYLPVPMTLESKGLMAELSLREIAYQAGLGTIGKNRLLITREFGPRVRLGAILTDAPLIAGKPIQEDFCTDCQLCLESCPTGSLNKEGEEAIMLCTRHHMKYGLPGLIRFAIKLIKAPSEEEKIKLILSPEFWEYWQNLNTGIFYYCYNCLTACPIGR